MGEDEDVIAWPLEPDPYDPYGCWGCHQSGDGDCSCTVPGHEGACSRCLGYGVEPEVVVHDGHWHWGYGSSPGQWMELGPAMFDESPPAGSLMSDL